MALPVLTMEVEANGQEGSLVLLKQGAEAVSCPLVHHYTFKGLVLLEVIAPVVLHRKNSVS